MATVELETFWKYFTVLAFFVNDAVSMKHDWGLTLIYVIGFDLSVSVCFFAEMGCTHTQTQTTKTCTLCVRTERFILSTATQLWHYGKHLQFILRM